MAGFAKGEGSFQVDIRKSQTTIMSMGHWVNGSMGQWVNGWISSTIKI